MNKSRYDLDEIDLIKNNSPEYRRSILVAFRKFTNIEGNEKGKPEYIIQAFSHFLKEDADKIYDTYYDDIRNLKRNTNSALKKIKLFSLIEMFVFKYCEEELFSISIEYSLRSFGKNFSGFFSNSITIDGSHKHEWYCPKNNPALEDFSPIIKTNNFYRIQLKERPFFKEHVSNYDEFIKGSWKRYELEEIYLYFQEAKRKDYCFAICFNNTEDNEEVFYGILNLNTNMTILKSAEDCRPVFIQLASGIDYESNGGEDEVYIDSSYPVITKHGIGKFTNGYEYGYKFQFCDLFIEKMKKEKIHHSLHLKKNKILDFLNIK